MKPRMTRDDVLILMEMYKLAAPVARDREVIDGLIRFMKLKFEQHVLEYRYAERERGQDSSTAL